MLKERSKILRETMILADACLLSVSYLLSYFFTAKLVAIRPFAEYFRFLPLFAALWCVLLYVSGVYNSFRTKSISSITFSIFKIAVIGIIALSVLFYFFNLHYLSKTFIFLTFTLAGLILTIEKSVIMFAFHIVRKKGYNYRNLLVVGTGDRAQSFIKLVKDREEWGLKIVGLIDEDIKKIGKRVGGIRIIGTLSDIPRIVHKSVIDEVMFIVPRVWLGKIEEAMLSCEVAGVKVSVAMNYFNLKLSRIRQVEMGGFPLLTFESGPSFFWPLVCKRFMDILISLILLILLSPLMAVTALTVKLTSRGPVFFRQERCSLNRRKFTLYKFRTMDFDAESKRRKLVRKNEMKGPAFKITNDPRVNTVGRFLRKTSIDELPQLWNVLVGDMSLVGPRPPIPAEVAKYEPWHRRRLSMRPGITCLWQIGGRNRINDFNEWARLDLEYIDRWSLWLDIVILLKTVPVVLMGTGAR